MRSTVIIDDELFRKAKRRAAERGTTLSGLVNQALRESLAKPETNAPPFRMTTFGDPRTKVHREPSDFHAASEDDDRRSLRR
jgi:Bacterial antitoxin of type II TA system, VapB